MKKKPTIEWLIIIFTNMTPKHPLLIGRNDTTILFSLFGCITLSLDALSPDEIILKIQEQASQIGIIYRTAEVSFSERQEQFLTSLDIPMITIPTKPGEGDLAVSTFEKLTERAVGMKLDFLKD